MEIEIAHKQALEELRKAYAKHGYARWGRHEFYGILREEFDELWDDVKADAPQDKVDEEILQIIAVCYRYLDTGDRYAHKYKTSSTDENVFMREIIKQDVPPYKKNEIRSGSGV